MGGSFGRIQGSAQWGKQVDRNWSVYGALEGIHDNGFRNFSASDVRRFYGDVGYRFEGNEFHLNGGVANNSLAGPSTVPAELLQQYWGATYTTPQTISNKVGYLNLTGKVEATPTWTFEGTAHALIAQLDERADAAFGDVDALLVERHTLIGNLVEIVRAFAAREHQLIRDVLDARIDALEAISGSGGVIQSETQIASVLQNLFTVSENYPALASAAHYSTLRSDLIRIEDRITAARKFYNLAVEELNSVRRAFPGNFIAMIGHNPPREKFVLGERRAELAEPVKIAL